MGFSKAALVVAVVALTCNDPSLFRDIHSLWCQVCEWESFGTKGPGGSQPSFAARSACRGFERRLANGNSAGVTGKMIRAHGSNMESQLMK